MKTVTRLVIVPMLLLLAWAIVSTGCGGTKDSGVAANFKFQGKLASTSVRIAGESRAKTVTHVMAVNPTSANPDRRLATVATDGTFSINVVGNRPWVLVFIDSSKTGAAMIVGLLKMSTLDALPARLTDGSTDLGTTSIDGTTAVATPGASLATVLAALGVTQSEADVMGAIDDIAARYANPDIDANGVIDVSESKTFALDFHMRFDMKKSGGAAMTVDDVVAAFPADSMTISYSLGSAYGIWPTSFHSGTYVTRGTLVSGNSLTITPPSGAPGSYSALAYGTSTGFGGDWSTTEMGGSTGGMASFAYAFGSRTLTFTNVLTYTLAQLGNNANRIMPFFRFVPTVSGCTAGCQVSSVEYKWMKNSATGWVAAMLVEVGLVVNDDGGFLSIYKGAQAGGRKVEIKIPPTALTGSFTWSTAGLYRVESLTAAELAALTTDQLCHVGLSYDDKLGMRIFGNIGDGDNSCAR